MARTEPRTGVTVEVFVEQEMVPPVGVFLKVFGAAIYRPAPVAIAEKDSGKPVRDLLGDLEQVHQATGTGRAFDFEIVSIVGKEIHQGTNDQGVHRYPNWS